MILQIIFAILIILTIVLFIVFDFSAFGTNPDKELQTKLGKSPHYDKENKIFLNRRPNLIKEMRERAFSFEVLKEWFSKGIDRSPEHKLPEVKPDLHEFLKSSQDLKVIWLGHSTFLLNIEGKILLIDPVFNSAAPSKYLVTRFQEPVLKLEELPPIDFIIISHDHYDHLDMQVMKYFTEERPQQNPKILTPLGVSSHLIGWGMNPDRITELDWWESHRAGDLEFVATPAQHFSGRNGIKENQTLWASWVMRSQKHNVYFSGDSGYDTHFKVIGDKFGPFDLAFIENGQYNVKWKEVHILPEETVLAYHDLRAKRYFPIHWGMFVLAFHSWYEPIVKLARAAKENNVNLVSPKLGQMVTINDEYKNEPWWESLISQKK